MAFVCVALNKVIVVSNDNFVHLNYNSFDIDEVEMCLKFRL